ncbi:MAG TPA: hypothetical protein VI756_15690, partial [Blastocatellia bacterium]
GSQFVFQAATQHNKGNPLGVNWTLMPASGEGTLSNAANPTDGSPSSVTYTAPATKCSNCVTITATSVENPSSTDSDAFSIGGGTAVGTYILTVTGSGTVSGQAINRTINLSLTVN